MHIIFKFIQISAIFDIFLLTQYMYNDKILKNKTRKRGKIYGD